MSDIQTRYREDGSTDWATMLEDLMGREWIDALHKELFEGWMNEITNPMSPDCTTLSQHVPASQTADSRDSAGQGAGPLEPFQPTIRVLPPRAHDHPEGCECETCAWIAETLERSFPLRQVEAY